MLLNLVPVWNSSWTNLSVTSGTVEAGNKTSGWSDGDVGDSGSEGSDFWWEEEGGGSENPPVVKFGPDPKLMQAIGVYVNFLVFAAALVLVVAVACKCVAGKVRLSLNRESGPEIAFRFGASNGVIDRVVVEGVDSRRCGGNGVRTGDSHRLAL